MEHRAFTPDHFRLFHPGGKLGARLLKVGDLMHPNPPLVPEGMAMGDTLVEISRNGFGVVGVTDTDGLLTGIITDGDLRRHLDGLMTRKAGDVMTRGPRTIGPEALAGEALAVMNERKITCLLVTETDTGTDTGRHAIGILHVHDCLRAGLS
jgi:arabinose-5-phosphate isomerase